MNDPWLVDVEAYVLGALDEAERAAFEEHLRGCATCRAAVDEVGAMPAALDLVPPDLLDAIAAEDPVTAHVPQRRDDRIPESVLATLLWSARREARRRRRRAVGAALAVAAVVLLLLVVPASPLSLVGRSQPAVEVLAMSASTEAPITASVALEAVAWGTRIDLSCTYGESGDSPESPYAPSPTYALVLQGSDGSSEQIATWAAVPDRTITVPAATSRALADISSIEVVDSDGTVLLTLDL